MHAMEKHGRLTIAATPIGNLGDRTLRLIDALRTADVICAEDTRVSQHLFDDIVGRTTKPRFVAVNEHVSPSTISRLLEDLLSGAQILLLSDAGTPGVSDPGGKLVEAIWQHVLDGTILFSVLPGPSAVTTALSVCGFFVPTFRFIGFFPRKKGKQTLLTEIARMEEALVFFESPFRIHETLRALIAVCAPERKICICRELTKHFEQIWRGTIATLSDGLADIPEKGEFTIVLESC